MDGRQSDEARLEARHRHWGESYLRAVVGGTALDKRPFLLYNRQTMADKPAVDDLGMDWARGARKYDYHLARVLAYAEVTVPDPAQRRGHLIDYHQAVEFGVVLSGRVERRWEGFSRESLPGDVWMASMWEPHGYRNPDEGTATVQVYFLPDFLGDIRFEELSWLTIFSAPPDQRPQISTPAQRERVLAWGQRMREEIERQPLGWLTAVKLAVINILFELSRDWQPPRTAPPYNNDPHASLTRIMPALDLIRERGPQFVGVAQAARACSMSRTTLNRLFRQTMGLTFGKFRIRAHLSRAAHLLLTTDLPTDKIAEEAGFSDGSHLHRSFLKRYGQTPGQYRENGRPRIPEGADTRSS